MAGCHHSPAAASGNPQSHQNDVTPAVHNQQSGTIHRRRNSRKIQTLINAVNFVPFLPKLLILNKQEHVLKRLGLYNFSKIKLDQNIRPDLIAQVIANYDPKKRCSFVNGKRVRVNRADLARALELPVGKQDFSDNDLGVFSDEDIEFVDDFVFNWMLIHEESWAMPEKIVRMTRCVRDGHPEKLDSASLIWYKVERELVLGVKLVDCYYASHLQRLVRSQCEELFEVDEDDGEHIEKVSDVDLTLRHETVGELVDSKNNAGEQLLQHCETSDLNNNREVKVEEDEDDGEHVERVSIVQDDNSELTLGHATVDEQVGLNDNLGEQLLQRCQFSDLNNNEKVKVEDVVDEKIVEVENDDVKEDGEHIKKISIVQEGDAELTLGDVTMDNQVDLNGNLGEQVLQRCQFSDLNNNEVKAEDIVDEQIVEMEDVDEVKEDEEDGEHIKKVSMVQEENAELTLGDVTMDEQVDLNDNLGEQLLQRSERELNNNEEVKVEDVVDEQIVEVEDDVVKEGLDNGECKEKVSIVQEDNVQLTLAHNVVLNLGDQTVDKLVDSKNNSGEQMLQHGQTRDLNNNEVKAEDVGDKQILEVEDVNDDDGEKFVEGLDMVANDDSVDVVESRDDSFIPHGGPSFFDINNNNNNNNKNNNNNNGKRVMESEDNIHHPDMNNKRLKTIDIWDHNQSEFGQCMVQMNQWIEKAKMITDSKQQIYANHKYHQDSVIHELQDRQQVMEMIIKSKDEELEKKHTEVYRLEHELYLMHDLLSGYIKALNDEHIKFSDYRKRVAVQEKHALKDVGSSGMVSSTRELEEVVSNDANVSEEKGNGEEH